MPALCTNKLSPACRPHVTLFRAGSSFVCQLFRIRPRRVRNIQKTRYYAAADERRNAVPEPVAVQRVGIGTAATARSRGRDRPSAAAADDVAVAAVTVGRP